MSVRFRKLIGSPHAFIWSELHTLATTSAGTPVVAVDNHNADYSIASGKQVTLSRGSTSQSNVVVTFTGATQAQMKTDINAVFGLAAGKPTDFAFDGPDGLRLQDTVSLAVNTSNANYLSHGFPIVNRSASNVNVAHVALETGCAVDRLDLMSDAMAIPDGVNMVDLVTWCVSGPTNDDLLILPMWDFGGGVTSYLAELISVPPLFGNANASAYAYDNALAAIRLAAVTTGMAVPVRVPGGAQSLRVVGFGTAAKYSGTGTVPSEHPATVAVKAYAYFDPEG